MANLPKTITLKNGLEMPKLALGVWQISDSAVDQVIGWALDAGYRHIDTARAYRNEAGVGRAIRQSGLARDKIFVTTKLLVFDYFRPETAFTDSLRRLGMDYVDLYLLHWPFLNWKNAWRALEKIYHSGRARAIGVSNFSISQLQELQKMGGLMPLVNQVEISPFLTRQKLVDYCQSLGIAVEAYSPLTRGKRLDDPTLVAIAGKYRRSPAQIIIRWGLQHDLVMIPKSATKSHLHPNIDVFDFALSQKDMDQLDALNENYSAMLPGWSRKD